MIEKRYSGLKNVKMLVKIFVQVPTSAFIRGKWQGICKKARSYTMQISKSELIMSCPSQKSMIRTLYRKHAHSTKPCWRLQGIADTYISTIDAKIFKFFHRAWEFNHRFGPPKAGNCRRPWDSSFWNYVSKIHTRRFAHWLEKRNLLWIS